MKLPLFPKVSCFLPICAVFLLFSFTAKTYSQNLSTADSLISVLGKQKSDTAKLSILKQIVENISDDNIWPTYNDEAFILSAKLSNSEIPQLNKIGLSGLANALNNKGYDAINKGELEKGVKYYQAAIETYKKLNDKNGEASTLTNLGFVFFEQHDFEKAEKYYLRSLKLSELAGNSEAVSTTLNNLGGLYFTKKEYEKAMAIYEKSFSLRKAADDKMGMAYSLHNIGSVYFDKKDLNQALNYFFQALSIRRGIDHLNGIALSYSNISSCLFKMNKKKEAINYADSALVISKKIGYPEAIGKAALVLATLYRDKDDYRSELIYVNLYHKMKDSIFNSNTQKNALQQQSDFESKLARVEVEKEQERKDIIVQAESLKKNLMIGFILVVLLLVLIFSFFLYKRFILTKRQKETIASQKVVVDEKNHEILDSINYAKRIQDAILPKEDDLKKFFADSFILFHPKDIVSGDFYWIEEKNGYFFVAVADSTGHGVPGAFMSMLGSSLLNEIVLEKSITDPADILEMLRVKIIVALKQKGESGENKDGMDMILCRFDPKKQEMIYAAANNPLWVVGKDGFKEFPCDKQPVGISIGAKKAFNQLAISYRAGDQFYLFTDGFADQFGGPKGKKYKYKQFKNLITDSSSVSMPDQKTAMENSFNQWRGSLEQIDDVCIIGLKL